MKFPAVHKMSVQDCYPMQAEGGFTGDIHQSVHAALVAWEKKRNSNAHFKYGRSGSLFRREKTATASREDISWNDAPEIKRAPKPKAPKQKKPRTDSERERNRLQMRRRRENETPEQRAERLHKRREAHRIKMAGKYKGPKQKLTPEERRLSKQRARKKYNERVKLGLVVKKPYKRSPLTPEQLAAKAARQRKYYYQNKAA